MSKNRPGNTLKIIVVIIILIAVILTYSEFPSIVSSNPKDMKNGQSYYLYGKIVSLIASSNRSIFFINDSGYEIKVIYDGNTPGVGSQVLVYGNFVNKTILGISFEKYVNAKSVTQWYF